VVLQLLLLTLISYLALQLHQWGERFTARHRIAGYTIRAAAILIAIYVTVTVIVFLTRFIRPV